MDSENVPRGTEAREEVEVTQADIDEISVLEVVSKRFIDAIRTASDPGTIQITFKFRVKDDGSLFECRLRRLG